uniref:Replication termination factor 2 n=1 Tax=Neogobius melanostomus TaxID=47308 RepID=A0A8C6SN87_9GOBI
MGCDGGTIPKRHELVKGPKKVEKVDKSAEMAARWKYCALSQEKLKRPIVSCELGKLYNKDAVIEYLLDKSAERPNSEAVTHIRGIKDIKELNLTDNPEWEGERRNTKGDIYEDIHCGMFICPVVGLEMNGKHRFCYLQTCGCVFSDRALKEVKTEICHKCGDPFKYEDLVVLNGTKEEMDKLREKMEEKRAKAKAKMTQAQHKQGKALWRMERVQAAMEMWLDQAPPKAAAAAAAAPSSAPSRECRTNPRSSSPSSPLTARPSAPKTRRPTGSRIRHTTFNMNKSLLVLH